MDTERWPRAIAVRGGRLRRLRFPFEFFDPLINDTQKEIQIFPQLMQFIEIHNPSVISDSRSRTLCWAAIIASISFTSGEYGISGLGFVPPEGAVCGMVGDTHGVREHPVSAANVSSSKMFFIGS
jgi:hypothetical protein